MNDTTSTTQTGQPSSGQQNPSQSGDQGSSGGSPHTQTTKPDWLPDAHWDTASSAIKPEFAAHFKELSDTHAAHQARIAARPAEPAGYELKFPDGFKPEVAVTFDDKDPRLADFRAFAHEQGWDQPTFSRALQIEAARVVAEQKMIETAQAAEIKKLGANGTARVTAVKTWLSGIVGKDPGQSLMDRMVTATDIEALEKLQLAFSTQGGTTYSNGGREPPSPPPRTHAQILYPNMQAKG